MSTFDDTGLSMDRLATIKAKLIADFQSAYGDDIKTTPDAVFGMLFVIFSEMYSDQNELIAAVANAFNPQAASGFWLSNLVTLNGIARNEAEYSTAACEFTANAAGCTVLAGSIVSSPTTGEKFEVDSNVVCGPSATVPGNVTAIEPGAIAASLNTITVIDTPIYGWDSVTNTAIAVEGADEETDSELRARRRLTSRKSGSSSPGAIYAALADLDGVTEVKVEVDNTLGSVHSVIQGGSSADIAQTLFERVTGGIGTSGGTMTTYADPDTGDNFDMLYDRPSDVLIYIDVNLTKYADYPTDGDDQVKQAVIDYFAGDFTINERELEGFGIDDDIIHSRMYTPVNSIRGHSIDSVKIGFAASPTGEANLSININQIGIVNTSTIQVI